MTLKVQSPSAANRIVEFAHSAAVTSKVPIVNNSRCFLPLNTALISTTTAYLYYGELANCPKATGEAWTMFQLLYWDPIAGKFTTTTTSNTKAGYALAAAASGDTTGSVLFDSTAT